MRLNRQPMTRGAAALTLAVLALAGPRADAQQTYPQTLYWGAGLVDIPVAWISPVSGDFAVSVTGQSFNAAPVTPYLAAVNNVNSNFAMSFSIFGRGEIGFSMYSSDPEWGFFGQGLVLDEEDYRGKSGTEHWMPSLALGVRNVGAYTHVDRYTMGYELFPGTPGGPGYVRQPDSLHQNFKTANTIYGVITKSFALSEIKDSWGHTNLSVSLGYGNGLFASDGGLGKAYSNQATGGFFGGLKVDVHPSKLTTLAFMLEQDGWQWNLGANYDWRGLRFGLYWVNVAPGAPDPGTSAQALSANQLYNYSKVAFTVSWQSNVLGVVHGDFLQQKEQELTRQTLQLQQEIAAKQQRIAALSLEISRYEAQNLLEIEQRRAAAEQALRQEKDALKRLEERLQKLEQNAPPPANPPNR